MAMLLTLAYQGQALAMSEIPSTAKTEAAHQEALGWSSASDLVDDTASRMDRFSCRAQGPEHRILITINILKTLLIWLQNQYWRIDFFDFEINCKN